VDRLLAELNSLADFPRRYAVIEDATLPFDVRRMPIPPFRALYRVIEQQCTVEVLTVRHGRQKS
jgi:plasmid stabilization system protein ParE